VRTDRYRYTQWRDFATGKTLARELYDHREDPDENHNIIENPPEPELFAEARSLLERQFPRRGYDSK
jgi:iduronate 2-sulfatase